MREHTRRRVPEQASRPNEQRPWRGVGLILGAVVAVVLNGSVAYADHIQAPRAVQSDNRAEFFEGNIKGCSDDPINLEIPPTIQVGESGNLPASDENVSGSVGTNSGQINPGQGEELNVSITNPEVVIDAVVIKAGNGFNVYRDPEFLPPNLPDPQNYIGPLVGAGNVPDISHWFICYHLEMVEPLPVGSVSVIKTLLRPAGMPAESVPTEFTAEVTCTHPDATVETQTVTFGAGGGVGEPAPALDELPENTVCTVEEQNTDDLPDGTVVTYNPPEANTTGVTIGADEPVVVEVINDFADIEVQTGSLRILKVVEPGGVPLPDTLDVHVACTTPDAQEDDVMVDLTVPGTGGEGTPVLDLPAGTFCAVAEETNTLPEGTVVTYQVDDGEPTTEAPVAGILGNTATTVTITNAPPEPEPEPTPPDVLPETGVDRVAGPLMLATALAGAGVLALTGTGFVRRRSDRPAP